MRAYRKQDFPVGDVRRFLEPGPIVLVSSAWKGRQNIMTMGWHMILGEEPSLVGCYVWSENHSRHMIAGSKECVINVPTVDLAKKVVGIGNTSGRDVDKFAEFKLTAVPGTQGRGAADRGMLRELRVQAQGREPHRQVQPVRAGGGEGARRHLARLSAHHALPRRRRVHAVGHQHGQVSAAVQAGDAMRRTPARGDSGSWRGCRAR